MEKLFSYDTSASSGFSRLKVSFSKKISNLGLKMPYLSIIAGVILKTIIILEIKTLDDSHTQKNCVKQIQIQTWDQK